MAKKPRPDKRWAMVQINDGATCVTIHPTEEQAYLDIIETCFGDTNWICLYEDEDADEIE